MDGLLNKATSNVRAPFPPFPLPIPSLPAGAHCCCPRAHATHALFAHPPLTPRFPRPPPPLPPPPPPQDDNPTPGYVYTELAKITHQDASTSDKMADWLYKRLARSEACVKFKVLKVMALVCKTGRMEFRRALQRQNEAVKQCQQFKGPPDPLRGDEPYRKVREAANEALQAMFDSSPAAGAGGGAGAAMSSRITGMSGGGAAAGPAYPPAGGGGGFSTALPGQPGYDPSSPMHSAPVTSGTMQSFGNYDPGKETSGALRAQKRGGGGRAFPRPQGNTQP